MWPNFAILLLFSLLTPLLPSSATSIDFLAATVSDLLTLLEHGQVTSEHLVTSYLSRIEQNNHQGLHLRAVLDTAPSKRVIQFARILDAERSRGKIRGRLHGIPILIKDNIATDVELGMNTTAGSFALGTAYRYGVGCCGD